MRTFTQSFMFSSTVKKYIYILRTTWNYPKNEARGICFWRYRNGKRTEKSYGLLLNFFLHQPRRQLNQKGNSEASSSGMHHLREIVTLQIYLVFFYVRTQRPFCSPYSSTAADKGVTTPAEEEVDGVRMRQYDETPTHEYILSNRCYYF